MFEHLLKIVVDGGHGVRAYGACAKAAREQMAKEPENAAALTLIISSALGVVEAYDDQPLSVDTAENLLASFKSMITKLSEGYATGSVDAKLQALNEVSIQFIEASVFSKA